MSAICGVLHIDGKPVALETASEMMYKLNIFPADTTNIYREGQIFMGCSMKYITLESKQEKLPFYDYEAGLVITADAIIDNRAELFDLLDLHLHDCDSITDSYLILLAFKKWGEECLKYLIGDFAFAIWNAKKKELFCARDHVGKRTFYFYYAKSIFAFCTVIKPLFVIEDDMKKVNDRWIADFLSLPGVAHEFDCNQTPYKDVQQLLPAHTIRITPTEVIKKKYWFPLDVPKLKLKSDKEYIEAFKEVFFEAIGCRLRSLGPVGIMMSGGLDSSSVACVAAQKLAANGERLQAFSSVPFSGYKNWLSKAYVADERPYIELIGEKVRNIDIRYCSCEDKNSFTNVKELIEMLEQPYKIIENLYWYNGIAEIASKQGCTVLLDGQYGNSTISYGSFWTQAASLFREGKLITLLKEINGYSKLYNLNQRGITRRVAYENTPYSFRRFITKLKGSKYDFTELLPVNQELAKWYDVEQRFNKEDWSLYPYKSFDLSQSRNFSNKPQAFSHIGALETKVSLTHGIAKRDPTRDKRVIEFCYSLPGNQFVRDGKERILIRRAMEGILPDEVRLNYKVRGQQSADWIQRIIPEWGLIRMELEEMLLDNVVQPYLDVPKLKRVLNEVGDSLIEKDWSSIRMLLISLIFGYFLREIVN